MKHVYTRHCFRVRDGKAFRETVAMTGEEVAAQTNRDGRRPDFLELLNRWNASNIGPTIGYNGFIYCYVAEATSEGN